MGDAPERRTLVHYGAMSSARPWHLQLLGSPQLVSPEGDRSRCERKPLAVLAVLALEGPTSRSRLAGLLWPDTPDQGARNNLVQLLRRMHRTYGDALVVLDDPLQLSPHVLTDVRSWTTAPPGLEGLLEGVEFDDLPDLADWLRFRREQLDAGRSAWLSQRAQEFEAAGRLPEAIEAVQGLLQLNALSEEHHRQLMRLQYLNNDRPAALRTYQRCQQVLARELGVEPMPATTLLAQEIERGAVQAAALPAPQLPLSVRRPPVLVGREAQWEALERAWRQGTFIIVSGAPGAGKSRLMHDFVATKGPVLKVEARPGDRLVPYATTARNLMGILAAHPELQLKPWQRRALAPLLPHLLQEGDLDLPDEAPLHAVIQDLFQIGARDVTAIVYEDMQYADPASIEAGLVLISSAFPLGQAGGVPHMLCTVRDDELNESTARTFRDMTLTGLASEIHVLPLGDAAAAALLEQLDLALTPAARRRLSRFAGGNPLYLLETVRSLLEQGGDFREVPERFPVPEKVSRIIARRLERLSTGALNVARTASVLQSDFDVELVAEVLGVPLFDVAVHWAELEAAQVVQGAAFTHDLIYESILQGIPGPIRTLLHRSAARVLTRSGASRARIALQWQHSGQVREAAPLFVEAAQEAARLGRRTEAQRFLDTAEAMYRSLGDEPHAERVADMRAAFAHPG